MSKSESRLMKWVAQNEPRSDLIFRDGLYAQVAVVRDRIAGLLARSYEEYCDLVDVAGSHVSKSVTLPVYHIHLPKDGVKVWMRNNFFNWNVSVESKEPLDCNFLNCFDDTGTHLFMEGMERWRFGPYSKNNRQFSVCIFNDYDLYVFFRAIKAKFNILPTN